MADDESDVQMIAAGCSNFKEASGSQDYQKVGLLRTSFKLLFRDNQQGINPPSFRGGLWD